MAKREKTDSITHLVKIVAREVFEDQVGELYTVWDGKIDRITILERQVRKLFALSNEVLTEEVLKRFNSIQSNLEKAGRVWSKDEDELLVWEVRTAVATIAKSHQRSKGAIRDRISQKIIQLNALGEGCLID